MLETAEKFKSFHTSLVYLNLHLTKQLQKVTYSVSGRDGKIAFHTHNVLIKNAKFTVNEKARQRVVANQQKEVHAGVKGQVELDPQIILTVLSDTCYPVAAYYNPYDVDCFVVGVRPIVTASWVYLTSESNRPKLTLYEGDSGLKFNDTHDPFAWKAK